MGAETVYHKKERNVFDILKRRKEDSARKAKENKRILILQMCYCGIKA